MGGVQCMMILHMRSHAEQFAHGIRTKLSGRDTNKELLFLLCLLSVHSHVLGHLAFKCERFSKLLSSALFPSCSKFLLELL